VVPTAAAHVVDGLAKRRVRRLVDLNQRPQVAGRCPVSALRLCGESRWGNRRGVDDAAGVEKQGAAVDPGHGELTFTSWHAAGLASQTLAALTVARPLAHSCQDGRHRRPRYSKGGRGDHADRYLCQPSSIVPEKIALSVTLSRHLADCIVPRANSRAGGLSNSVTLPPSDVAAVLRQGASGSEAPRLGLLTRAGV
jgi:hypothetical protein